MPLISYPCNLQFRVKKTLQHGKVFFPQKFKFQTETKHEMWMTFAMTEHLAGSKYCVTEKNIFMGRLKWHVHAKMQVNVGVNLHVTVEIRRLSTFSVTSKPAMLKSF